MTGTSKRHRKDTEARVYNPPGVDPARSRFAIYAAPCYARPFVRIPWLVALLLGACGGSDATPPPPHRDGAATQPQSDATTPAPLALPPRPLGLIDLTGWQWRTRAGHPAFKLAREAEAKHEWADVASACARALAADPSNLEAAWLLAVADGKLGRLEAITQPLVLAGTGDFAKWALASLAQPALQPYLATPAGLAWRARVDADRPRFAASLAHATIVIAKGDLFAYADQRWYRLTRTFGAVAAAFSADGQHLAYLTRGPKPRVGSVDLSTGLTTRPQVLLATSAQIAYSAKGFWIAQPGSKPRLLSLAANDQQGLLISTTGARPRGAWLERYATGGTHVHRTPAGISADWDDQGLASAIRIASSNRVVTVPGQIAGDTIAWSPDRAHAVFVAQIADHCEATTQTVAAYVIDTATGASTELLRASHGLAIDWVGDRMVAIAGDDGVVLQTLATTSRQPLVGATRLVAPRFAPRCEPTPADEPALSVVPAMVESDEDGSEN